MDGDKSQIKPHYGDNLIKLTNLIVVNFNSVNLLIFYYYEKNTSNFYSSSS